MAGREGKLYIGTVPDYGKLGGVLAVYDTAEGGEPKVIKDFIRDQSIVSLV